jgi:hypothetical protein
LFGIHGAHRRREVHGGLGASRGTRVEPEPAPDREARDGDGSPRPALERWSHCAPTTTRRPHSAAPCRTTSPDDPGREFALPEEARGLAFIDEDALVVVGESGALLRVDLVIGEAALIHRDWKHTMAPTLVTAAPSGQAIVTSNTGLHVQPPDPVPRDSSGLAAWLSQRTR